MRNRSKPVCTEADRREFDKKMGIGCKVCHDPVDLSLSVPSSHGDGKVLYVGKLATIKGADYLADIMVKITKAFPGASLITVGDGLGRAILANRIKSLGLERSVFLVGRTDDVYPYYRDASVLLQPSRIAGLGLTAVEAMSSGVPVVAFHNFVPDEIIRDGVDGRRITTKNK